ncbi:MAG TPA: hypothetical protein VLG49_02925 [Rhabdochlamydiaceae bacterium]|nr:hypothetical protein [Rhabdochlamydiaceae bacterium]
MSGNMRLCHVPRDPLELQSAAPNRVLVRELCRALSPTPCGFPAVRFCFAPRSHRLQRAFPPKPVGSGPFHVVLQCTFDLEKRWPCE